MLHRELSGIDYVAGLSHLWGDSTLKLLRAFVDKGEIEDHNIAAMAPKMGCKRTYNENTHKVNLVETYERMLEQWFNQNLYDFTNSKAKEELVKVLTEGRCSNKIVDSIKKKCDDNR